MFGLGFWWVFWGVALQNASVYSARGLWVFWLCWTFCSLVKAWVVHDRCIGLGVVLWLCGKDDVEWDKVRLEGVEYGAIGFCFEDVA